MVGNQFKGKPNPGKIKFCNVETADRLRDVNTDQRTKTSSENIGITSLKQPMMKLSQDIYMDAWPSD